MTDTLLEKALTITRSQPERRPVRPLTNEDVSLALAWLQGRVTLSAAAKVYYPKKQLSEVATLVRYRMSMAIREAYNRGLITVRT